MYRCLNKLAGAQQEIEPVTLPNLEGLTGRRLHLPRICFVTPPSTLQSVHRLDNELFANCAAASLPCRTQSGMPIPFRAAPASSSPGYGANSFSNKSTRFKWPRVYWGIALVHWIDRIQYGLPLIPNSEEISSSTWLMAASVVTPGSSLWKQRMSAVSSGQLWGHLLDN